MKIRLLTLLFAIAAPMLVFGQTITGAGGGFNVVGTSTGGNSYTAEAVGIAGSTLTGGLCPSSGVILPDMTVPATLGYNTEITNITLNGATHEFAEDLDLSLIAPDGTELTFSLDNGGSTGLDVAVDMCFDVTAADCADDWTSSTSVAQPANCLQLELEEDVCGPFNTQLVLECGFNEALFVAVAVEGTWTLQIVDDMNGDTGTFASFSITFSPMTPPTVDDMGTTIDLLACCSDICELTGPSIINLPLEAGECEEALFFELPGITGGLSCKFCSEMPEATYVASGLVIETLDADGFPISVEIEENQTSSYTITAVENATLSFDYEFVGSVVWDPFTVTGPSGDLTGGGLLTGTVIESLLPGESVVAQIVSLDGGFDGSALTLSNFQIFDPTDFPCYRLEQLSGPMMGDFIPPGSYGVEYEATPFSIFNGLPLPDDVNAINYTQAIDVLEYSGPITTALACNDLVNISVDENCSITMGADLFLEGGPYGCYDDYEINILIFGNAANQTGNVSGTTIDFGDLLGTHTYEITDPNTGNTCWGEFTAEDKLAPIMECSDITINCTELDVPTPLGPFSGTETGGQGLIIEDVNPDTVEFIISIARACATISDLDIAVDITHTWGQDINMEVVSPEGTTALVLPPNFGCGAQDDVFHTIDDEGTPLALCAQLNGGENVSWVGFGAADPMSTFDGENPAGDWTIRVIDAFAQDGGVINSISLIFENCDLPSGFPAGDACGNTSYTFSDSEVDNGCAGSTITRTWFATDASGNTSEGCEQMVTIENIGITDLLLPPALIELPCGNGTSPDDIVAFFDNPLTTDIPLSANCTLDVIERNEGHPFGYPYFLQIGCDGNEHPQIVNNNVCSIYATYDDQEIPACGAECNGNVKVIRTWTLLDWCTNETVPFVQLIKAVDDEGPTFIVQDITVSTDPWGCEANIEIPQPWELHDNCTDNLSYSVSGPAGVIIVGDAATGFTALGVPKGSFTFIYTAYDCCGNVTSVDATVTVVDGTPPVAVAKQNIVVSLTSSGTNNTGLAKIFAGSVDNGSHDGCTDVRLELRRDEDNCDVRGNATYNADGHPQDGSPNPNSPSYDPDGGAFVTFCCDDITNAVVDVNGDGENDPGYVKVWLRVWDDGDMNGIYGTAGDNFNETWTYVKVEDKLAPAIICPPDVTLTCDMDYTDLNMTGSGAGFASCGAIDVEYNDIIINLNSCNEGFVRRRWNIVGRSDIFCDQTITLEEIDAPVNVSFSQVQDFTAANCPSDIALGVPTWIAGPCDVLGYTLETDTFRFEDGACYKLVNNWTVINWCDYEPNNPFWNGEGLWEHIQIIRVTDETKPVIEDCADRMFEINDHSDSDDDGIVCEAKITLTNVATDPGSENCPTGWLKWQVFVDLWADGTDDLEYSSFLPIFDNQFNDTNGNGIGDIYLAPTGNGETVSVPLPDIPGSMSNHKVRWKVTDGCNNVTTCDYEFMVVDKKAPTPYCVSLSTAVMDMGPDGNPGVDLWAIDFNVGSFDNCSDQENLRYTFTDTPPQDDPLYDPAQKSSFKTFTCDDVANSPVEVQMYVWDEKNNADFCTVFLTIVDNQMLCTEGSRVAGTIETEVGNGVVDVQTTLDANLDPYPIIRMTDDNGDYAFNSNPNGLSYEISASKDVDHLNGVSTLDLVLIQRHILGLATLDSPYKLIAADINADNDIKASDLTSLRKAVLGVTTNFPGNESWRFPDAAQTLTMETPLENVDYVIDIAALQVHMDENDFVGVKIGDVSGDALANVANQTTQVRSNKSIVLSILDKEVAKGETVEVAFTSEDFADVYGYQFTMELNGLEFAGVQNGVVAMNDANVGVLSNNLVTVSYNSSEARTAGNAEAVFTATFVATKNGNLGSMIDITSKVTTAEAYVGQTFEMRDVTITTRGAITNVDVTELFQNEPNPAKGPTVIGFNLAEAADATMTVYDVTGKIIVKRNIDGLKGYNTVNFNSNQFGTSGVLYYTLESGDFTATKKMIIIE